MRVILSLASRVVCNALCIGAFVHNKMQPLHVHVMYVACYTLERTAFLHICFILSFAPLWVLRHPGGGESSGESLDFFALVTEPFSGRVDSRNTKGAWVPAQFFR